MVLTDRRAEPRKASGLFMAKGMQFGRQIKAVPKANRIEGVQRSFGQLMRLLKNGNVKEAWRTLRIWYRAVSKQPVKPFYPQTGRQTKGREELCNYMQPPGDSIPVNVMQSITDDSPSTEQTTKGAVMKSQNSFTGGTTKMGAKDLKQ